MGTEAQEIIKLLNQGEYDLALENITKIGIKDKFEISILKSITYREQGYKKQAIEFAEKGLEISENANSQRDKTLALINIILATLIGGPFDHLPNLLSKAQESFKKTKKDKTYLEASLLMTAGAVSFYIGDPIEGLSHLEEALILWEELELPDELARTHHFIARIYSPRRAISLMEKTVEIWKSFSNRPKYAKAICFIGSKYILLGDFNQAIKLNQEALKIFVKINHNYGIANACDCLGMISLARGEPKDAIKYFKKAADIWKPLENPYFETISLQALGRAYYHLGHLDLALNKLIESMHIRQELGLSGEWLVELLFHMVRCSIELRQSSDVKMYNMRLQELQKEDPTPNSTAFAHLANAIILQNSDRLRNKMESQTILEQVSLDDPNIKWAAKILTIKYLCQALIIEIAHDNSPALLKEIETFIEKILKIAKYQHLNSIEIEAMIFKSKLDLVQGNISDAQLLLSKASNMAKEYNLGQMISLVELERSTLTKGFDKWQEMEKQNYNLKERIKQAEITEYLSMALDLKDRSYDY